MGRDVDDEREELELELLRFRRRVELMREVGALQWGDISLGEPPPDPEDTPPEHDDDDFPGWPKSNADVYLDEFSYANGVPHLKRETTG